MQEYPGLLIAVARRSIKQAVLVRAARRGLSNQQFWMLVNLEERPGASLGELADRMIVDAPTASRVLAALVRRKLVRAEQDPADRRRSRLYLTRSGEALARALGIDAREIRAAIADGLSASDLETLRRVLRRVIANLERLGGSSGDTP